MSDTLFDISQYQSHAHVSYSADWRDATGTDPAWEQPDSVDHKGWETDVKIRVSGIVVQGKTAFV